MLEKVAKWQKFFVIVLSYNAMKPMCFICIFYYCFKLIYFSLGTLFKTFNIKGHSQQLNLSKKA